MSTFSNMANDVVEIVNKAEFDARMQIYFNNNSQSKNCLWNKMREQFVIQKLTEITDGTKKTAQHRNLERHYELMSVSGNVFVIVKRKNLNDPLIQLVPYENYYEKLLEAHIQSGHGGRDRMLFYLKQKYVISKQSCTIFVSMCKTCTRKRAAPRKGIVVKPILSDGFNVRGQVDLIDFQSCADGEFRFLMNYQDHGNEIENFCDLLNNLKNYLLI